MIRDDQRCGKNSGLEIVIVVIRFSDLNESGMRKLRFIGLIAV